MSKTIAEQFADRLGGDGADFSKWDSQFETDLEVVAMTETTSFGLVHRFADQSGLVVLPVSWCTLEAYQEQQGQCVK